MTPTIRISEAVYERLQEEAEPFVDTPDSVLRRLLGIASAAHIAPETPAADTNGDGTPEPSGSGSTPKPRRRRSSRRRGSRTARPPRAPRGSLMKDAEYELPILRVLAERGGRAGKNEVLDALEPLIGNQLTDLDRTPLASGEIRWRNRAQFVRLRLVQRGEMEKDSPRGIWELAEAGRERLHSVDGAESLAAAP